MTNFDFNIDNITSSELVVKASGSIIQEINNDLQLPDGDNIEVLLSNAQKTKTKNSR
jgi:hypothetical protein